MPTNGKIAAQDKNCILKHAIYVYIDLHVIMIYNSYINKEAVCDVAQTAPRTERR